MKVRDAMTEDVLTFTPGRSLRDAAKFMADHNVGAVVVMDPASGLNGIDDRKHEAGQVNLTPAIGPPAPRRHSADWPRCHVPTVHHGANWPPATRRL